MPVWFAFFLLSAATHAVVGYLAIRPRRVCPPDAHWTQKARLGWPFRQFGAVGPSAGAAMVMVVMRDHLADWWSVTILAWSVLMGSTVGLILATRGVKVLENRVVDWMLTLATSWIALNPTVILAYPVLALGLTRPWDPMTWAFGGVLILFSSGTLNPVTLGLGRRLGLVCPVTEPVVGMVRELSEELGMRPPKVLSIRVAAANAFALPKHRMILVTPMVERLLEPDLMKAILAHEMGHLAETETHGSIRILRASSPVVILLAIPLAGLLDWPLLPAATVVLYLVMLRRFHAWSSARETDADSFAGGTTGGPLKFARALERIHELGETPAVMGRKESTHPELVQRLAELGYTPEWSAPDPPSRARTMICTVSALLILVAVAVWWQVPTF